MIVTIHQPEYLPWLGYFDRIKQSDVFVVLDHVQYQRGYINRNRIKNVNGPQWLTVPIYEADDRKPINQVRINNKLDWQTNQMKSLEANYNNTPFFKDYKNYFQNIFSESWEMISDLDVEIIKKLLETFGLKQKVEYSSKLDVSGKATDLLVSICKNLGADTYLSGQGGKNYMEMDKFEKAGIKVVFQEFVHPEYKQNFPKMGFIPMLSSIDYLFNQGAKL